jgi:hypothetical protein
LRHRGIVVAALVGVNRHALNPTVRLLQARGYLLFLETREAWLLSRQMADRITTVSVCKRTGRVTYDTWIKRNSSAA